MASKAPAIVAAIATALGMGVLIDHQVVQRRHDANLHSVSQFKSQFDQQFPEGATFNEIEAYVASRQLAMKREITTDNYVRELRIEVVNERVPFWGCWRGSAGIVARFVDERLTQTELSTWSSQCLDFPRF